MIIYRATKKQFLEDASNDIADIISEALRSKFHLNIKSNSSEYNSWKNSLGGYIFHLLNSELIPDDVTVALEYVIPRTNNRIDLVLLGTDDLGIPIMIIIELKQWSSAELVEKDSVVRVQYGKNLTEQVHPSYQAWSYASLLESFNEKVSEIGVKLIPCAYLHNFTDVGVIRNKKFEQDLIKAPVFIKDEKEKLQQFIAKYIKRGDSSSLLYEIENSRVRPSKELADTIASMMQGNQEFILIDEQKLVFEEAINLLKKSKKKKQVYIVEGGPGTGKSVIAVNLLTRLINQHLLAQYVTKNSAPRDVYEAKLTGSLQKSAVSHLFKGSGSYTNANENDFDALIADEAHRLNEKSGIFKNLGENQIKEIIYAAGLSIFFIDEDQQVTWHDIGTIQEIEKWANHHNAEITYGKLETQFRCNGSNGYLSWLDNSLQIRETANPTLAEIPYDFRVFDNPNELRKAIKDKNKNNKARLLAGYCWDWISKKDKSLYDISFPEFDFKMQWNFTDEKTPYALQDSSIEQVGCIHTTQGLDFEYVGVIIGPDFLVRNGQVITNPDARSKTDKSLNGYKKDFKVDPTSAKNKADRIIKNTYRTLMSRGLKGCYIFCVDEETRNYFKNALE